MRIIFCFVLLLFTNFLFAQDSTTLKEIYTLIGFKCIDDTVNEIFHSCDTIQVNNSIDKKIIAIVDKEDTSWTGQIFVLRRKNQQIEIIDSSTSFERDGKGPRVEYQMTH